MGRPNNVPLYKFSFQACHQLNRTAVWVWSGDAFLVSNQGFLGISIRRECPRHVPPCPRYVVFPGFGHGHNLFRDTGGSWPDESLGVSLFLSMGHEWHLTTNLSSKICVTNTIKSQNIFLSKFFLGFSTFGAYNHVLCIHWSKFYGLSHPEVFMWSPVLCPHGCSRIVQRLDYSSW